MHTRKSPVTVLVAAALILVGAPAHAAPETLQDRIDAILQEHPGGIQIDDRSISWENGAVTLTLDAGTGARSIGTCATGSYCAFSGYNYAGTKLSFTSCSAGGSSGSLALLGNVPHSVANARTSGTVAARNGGSTIFNLGANSGNPAVTSTVTTLVCFT